MTDYRSSRPTVATFNVLKLITVLVNNGINLSKLFWLLKPDWLVTLVFIVMTTNNKHIIWQQARWSYRAYAIAMTLASWSY